MVIYFYGKQKIQGSSWDKNISLFHVELLYISWLQDIVNEDYSNEMHGEVWNI